MNKVVGAAEFKAKCLAILDEVQATGESVTVTKRGRPVAVVQPMKEATGSSLLDAMQGTVTIHGDIVGPIDPHWEAKWEAKWDARGFPAPDAKAGR